VAELANRAGLPMPRGYLMDNPQPNAFVTERNPGAAQLIPRNGYGLNAAIPAARTLSPKHRCRCSDILWHSKAGGGGDPDHLPQRFRGGGFPRPIPASHFDMRCAIPMAK